MAMVEKEVFASRRAQRPGQWEPMRGNAQASAKKRQGLAFLGISWRRDSARCCGRSHLLAGYTPRQRASPHRACHPHVGGTSGGLCQDRQAIPLALPLSCGPRGSLCECKGTAPPLPPQWASFLVVRLSFPRTSRETLERIVLFVRFVCAVIRRLRFSETASRTCLPDPRDQEQPLVGRVCVAAHNTGLGPYTLPSQETVRHLGSKDLFVVPSGQTGDLIVLSSYSLFSSGHERLLSPSCVVNYTPSWCLRCPMHCRRRLSPATIAPTPSPQPLCSPARPRIPLTSPPPPWLPKTS